MIVFKNQNEGRDKKFSSIRIGETFYGQTPFLTERLWFKVSNEMAVSLNGLPVQISSVPEQLVFTDYRAVDLEVTVKERQS